MRAIERLEQPIQISDQREMAQLEELLQAMSDDPGQVRMVSSTGKELELPSALVEVLTEAGRLLTSEDGVMVLSTESELSPQQASRLLNVSRPYLTRLLDRGDISFHRVGSHRRIKLTDVLEFRAHRDEERRGELKRLSELSRESGIPE